MNNDNDLNLHSMTKLSGWLRCWVRPSLKRKMSRKRDDSHSNDDNNVDKANYLSESVFITLRTATLCSGP